MTREEITTKYFDYAEQVVNGEITACSYVIAACKRNLARFDNDNMFFDYKAVDRVLNFISHLKLFTGEFAGKNFNIQPWQKNIIANTFGWKWKKNNLRVTRNLYLEVGRKNAKSTTIAAILLYMMVADGENNASVILAANSAKQASLCFEICSNLLKSIDPKDKYFKRYRDTIKFDTTVSKIKVLAADASKMDGENCHAFLTDELHEAPDGTVYNVLETSMGARQQPLACVATTAGFNLSSFCYEMRKNNIEVITGIKEDETLQAFIYTLDDGDDWKEEKSWIKSNPNLDVSVKRDFIRSQINKALNNSSLEISIRTKLTNVWLASENTWIHPKYIINSMQDINIDDFNGYYCNMGIDLASTCDMTALSVMVELDDKFYFKNWYFLPEAQLTESPNAEKYKLWARQGHLIVTPGNVTDYDFVLKKMLEINQITMTQKVSVDKWNATQFQINAIEQGMPIQEFPQTVQFLNRPTKEFERLILSDKIVIDKNPITLWMFDNVALKADWNENVRPVKGGTVNGKIDGIMAMLNALGGYLQDQHFDNEIITTTY